MKMVFFFLGAGKRLSLLESFIRAGVKENISIELHSIENSIKVPISSIAKIHVGPDFSDPSFDDWLLDTVRIYNADIIIPNMDYATVALSKARHLIEGISAWPLVSSEHLCRTMLDKCEADKWFKTKNLPVPGQANWPRIFKNRFGFGSRGQFLVRNENERELFSRNYNLNNFIEQEYLNGNEYTVDAYVDRSGQFISAMSRRRIRVSDGEVVDSLSDRQPEILRLSEEIFANTGWQGPLTAQFILTSHGPILIEVNPRFGGGVTHSIYCGLDFPSWIIKERLGRFLPKNPTWIDGSFMTRCTRDFFL